MTEKGVFNRVISLFIENLHLVNWDIPAHHRENGEYLVCLELVKVHCTRKVPEPKSFNDFVHHCGSGDCG